MTYLILANVFLAVALAVAGAGLLLVRRDPAVRRRIHELALAGAPAGAAVSLTQTGLQPSGLRRIVTRLGERVPVSADDAGDLRRQLMRAGFRDGSAPVFYVGLRLLAAISLPLLLLLTLIPGVETPRAILLLGGAAGLGWVVPSFVLGRLVRRRRTRIVDALPDTLDLLVVCVEAGLGLNQALMRVGREMEAVEPIVTDELGLVNLEMRAGKPRTEALKNLARRTGVEDIASLVSMLIQTDKFGTSVAHSLRVFADGMRTKRRQKAEEAAAKTTIKMVFPLALCILPALFVVVVGPAALHIFEELIQKS
ncbi:MAG: type II secretion system F family protein [Gemmatimonadota bacterium]